MMIIFYEGSIRGLKSTTVKPPKAIRECGSSEDLGIRLEKIGLNFNSLV